MRIESLELFVATAQTRSISQAAKQRFVTQQGASKSIRSLEHELNTQLFIRTPNGLELTQSGQRILVEARAILESHRRMQAAAAARIDEPVEGRLNIATTPFITNQLGTLLSQFEELNPKLKVRIIERNPFKIIKDFNSPATRDDAHAKAEQDTLRLVAIPTFATRVLESVRGQFVPLAYSVLMANGMANSPLEPFEKITAQQLAALPVVCYNEEFLNRLVHHQFSGLDPDIRLRTSNMSMFVDALTKHHMVTFTDSLSLFLNEQAPNSISVPIVDGTSFAVGFLGTENAGPTTQRFIEFAQRYFETACAAYAKQYDYLKPPSE